MFYIKGQILLETLQILVTKIVVPRPLLKQLPVWPENTEKLANRGGHIPQQRCSITSIYNHYGQRISGQGEIQEDKPSQASW